MSDWQEERGRRDRARREEVMRLPVLRARRHGTIDGQDDDVLVCASVGPVGELVVVWTAPEGLEAVSSTTVSPAGASFPDAASVRPVAARHGAHAGTGSGHADRGPGARAYHRATDARRQVSGGLGQVPVAARRPGPQR